MEKIKIKTGYSERKNKYFTTSFEVVKSIPGAGELIQGEKVIDVYEAYIDPDVSEEIADKYNFYKVKTEYDTYFLCEENHYCLTMSDCSEGYNVGSIFGSWEDFNSYDDEPDADIFEFPTEDNWGRDVSVTLNRIDNKWEVVNIK
ncbi:MAG: hypothetical protein MJ231_06700 [bacterium]|nr:hypothetical protein [bacterium]